MSRVNPSQFELDMSRVGKNIGDPIPKQVKSRPEPGEYNGFYDVKPAPAPAPAPVETKRTSEPVKDQADKDKGNYQTRQSNPK